MLVLDSEWLVKDVVAEALVDSTRLPVDERELSSVNVIEVSLPDSILTTAFEFRGVSQML